MPGAWRRCAAWRSSATRARVSPSPRDRRARSRGSSKRGASPRRSRPRRRALRTSRSRGARALSGSAPMRRRFMPSWKTVSASRASSWSAPMGPIRACARSSASPSKRSPMPKRRSWRTSPSSTSMVRWRANGFARTGCSPGFRSPGSASPSSGPRRSRTPIRWPRSTRVNSSGACATRAARRSATCSSSPRSRASTCARCACRNRSRRALRWWETRPTPCTPSRGRV